jgi:hypothetical protein
VTTVPGGTSSSPMARCTWSRPSERTAYAPLRTTSAAMLGGESSVANRSSSPGMRRHSQTSTIAGSGGTAAAGTRMVASTSLAIAALEATGLADVVRAGCGVASCARLVRGALTSSRSVGSSTNTLRTMTAILVGLALRGPQSRPAASMLPALPSQLRISGMIRRCPHLVDSEAETRPSSHAWLQRQIGLRVDPVTVPRYRATATAPAGRQ